MDGKTLPIFQETFVLEKEVIKYFTCLLYTSDAADDIGQV